jgi:hypothetical protein
MTNEEVQTRLQMSQSKLLEMDSHLRFLIHRVDSFLRRIEHMSEVRRIRMSFEKSDAAFLVQVSNPGGNS